MEFYNHPQLLIIVVETYEVLVSPNLQGGVGLFRAALER